MQEQSKSILEALQKYIAKCELLNNLDLHIEQVESNPTNYSIGSAGQVLLSEDVLGNQTWQYNAILQSREYTADDLSRLDNAAFTEQFIFYLQDKNFQEDFPLLPNGCAGKEIYADNGIILSLDEDGDRGIYQIQIHLIFEREVNADT